MKNIEIYDIVSITIIALLFVTIISFLSQTILVCSLVYTIANLIFDIELITHKRLVKHYKDFRNKIFKLI